MDEESDFSDYEINYDDDVVPYTVYCDGMGYTLSLDEEYIVKVSFLREYERDDVFEFEYLPRDIQKVIFGHLDDDLATMWRSKRVCRKWKSDIENLVDDKEFVARLSRTDSRGNNLLHQACYSSREETGFSLVMSYLNRGGSAKVLQKTNNFNRSPLDYASNIESDPLYKKVKRFPQDITNKDLDKILDVESKQIDRQNAKYVLNLVDKWHHWDIVFYLTLKYKDVTVDDFSKTDQNIAHLTGKICRDKNFDLCAFSKKEKRHWKKSIEYCVKYFLYEKKFEFIHEMQKRYEYSHKIRGLIKQEVWNANYVSLIRQDFETYEKTKQELSDGLYYDVLDDVNSMAKAFTFYDYCITHIPTPKEKVNILKYFVENYDHNEEEVKIVKHYAVQFGWKDPEFLNILCKNSPIHINWGEIFSISYTSYVDLRSWNTKDILKCINHFLNRNLISQDIACDILSQVNAGLMNHLVCDILRRFDTHQMKNKTKKLIKEGLLQSSRSLIVTIIMVHSLQNHEDILDILIKHIRSDILISLLFYGCLPRKKLDTFIRIHAYDATTNPETYIQEWNKRLSDFTLVYFE